MVMTFGEELKAHRKRLGMTQDEARAVLFVCIRSYIKWENGEGVPSLITQEGARSMLSKAVPKPARK